jgi:hypothetical protein
MKNATKISCLLTILVTNPSTNIQAFAPSSFSGRKSSPRLLVALSAGGYVPDGLSPAEYNKIKEADKKKVGKNLGKLGPRGFKSRSMQAWQEAYESGHAGHTFAPIDYKKMMQQGKIKKEEVPYMVRGGSWDNSDVKGAKKLQWSKKDKEYAAGGYKKEQSVSILGSGPGFDWTGTQSRDPNAKRSFPGLS